LFKNNKSSIEKHFCTNLKMAEKSDLMDCSKPFFKFQ
jgi:hypothetical protein